MRSCQKGLIDRSDALVKLAALAKAGATVREVKLPDPFTGLRVIARETINFHERAACMAYEWDHHREALSPQMRRYIEQGQKISRQDYIAGWRRIDECRSLLPSVCGGDGADEGSPARWTLAHPN